jgi:23S rRNA (cytidine1920-2'-O)/16S rRNA (cytidine1409-2'-O)-methyltransferase
LSRSRAESRRQEQGRRLDQALVERGLAESRTQAQALILAGDVLVDGLPATRAGTAVAEGRELTLKAKPRFVSRGAEKLEHALSVFALDVRGLVAADFGASAGGFTDALLQRGAARVYAIDVGYGQLADRLRADERVVVMDRVNVRNLTALPELVDLVTIDVSFIGLRLVLPAAHRVLAPGGTVVALVKPQFEAGREHVGRGGVVREPAVHRRVLQEFHSAAAISGFGVTGLTASPLRGPAGNIEFLAQLGPGQPSLAMDVAIERALAEAPAA